MTGPNTYHANIHDPAGYKLWETLDDALSKLSDAVNAVEAPLNEMELGGDFVAPEEYSRIEAARDRLTEFLP